MKYETWLNEWLYVYVKPTSKHRTFERYYHIVNSHLLPDLGNTELENLTPIVLQRYITNLLTTGNKVNGKGLAHSTINGIITVIKTTLKLAYELGFTTTYTGNKIKRPKQTENKVTCFNLIEQYKIEQAVIKNSKPKMFGVILCLYTGVRIGELLALEWCDVDFDNNILTISKACYDGIDTNGKFSRITDTPKTNTSKREIPLPKQIVKQLKHLHKITNSSYIICDNHGNGIKVRSYQRSFELLLNKLNIEHKSFHALRHTFATRALECGMDVKTLAEILGHKNPTITLNRYVHSMLEHKQNMMNKLGKILFEKHEKEQTKVCPKIHVLL